VEHLYAAVLLGLPLELVVVPGLLHPQVGGHDLVLQIDIDQLGQLQLDANGEGVRHIDHRADQFVVVAQQIVVQSFGIRIRCAACGVDNIRILDIARQWISGAKVGHQIRGVMIYV